MSAPDPSKTKTPTKPGREPHSIEAITRKVAKAVAHPLRVRILVALNECEMGPAEFTRRNPDVDLRDVSRHFRRLRDLECIELVGRRPGRGGERLYKAVRRAMFDLSSWQAVPPKRRSAVTEEVVSTYMHRVAQAAEAGTLDARDERWVSWTALFFDDLGWREFIAVIEGVFARSLELGVEAPLRLSTSGEPIIPVTVGLFCFESPGADDVPHAQHQPSASPGSFENSFLGLRSPKALATPLRVRILVELNRRPLSPTAFHAQFGGGPLQHVSVEFRRLEQLGCIEPLDRKKSEAGPGRPEQVYRAIRRSLFDEQTWKELPPSLRNAVTSITYTTLIERLAESAQAGLLDARDDRHLTWTGMKYDAKAWREMLQILAEAFQLSLRVHKESAERRAISGDQAIPVTVALSCFESPRNAEVTPEPVLQRYIQDRPVWPRDFLASEQDSP